MFALRALCTLAAFPLLSGWFGASSGTAKVGASRPTEIPALPSPSITFRVEPVDDGSTWRMTVVNAGDQTLRFAADVRLLTLEIKPDDEQTATPTPALRAKRAKKDTTVLCRLPATMRPNEVDDDRALLLGSGQSYAEDFDPALFCFTESEANTFLRGGNVVARLGFGATGQRRAVKVRGPFVAEPTHLPATLSAVAELVAPAVPWHPRQPATPAPASAPPDANDASSATRNIEDPGAPRLELGSAARSDAENERTLALTVTAKNTGTRPLRSFFRREGLAFDIIGPTGVVRCDSTIGFREYAPESIVVVGPGKTERIDALLGEICPDGTFDRPGLYRVRPSLVASTGSKGTPPAIWSGTATSDSAALVRVRTGPIPFYDSPPHATTHR